MPYFPTVDFTDPDALAHADRAEALAAEAAVLQADLDAAGAALFARTLEMDDEERAGHAARIQEQQKRHLAVVLAAQRAWYAALDAHRSAQVAAEYTCDDCGEEAPDGHGFYEDGRRVCAECA
jgi:formylmethanofuran dehydrogenase subunit E